MALLVEPTDVLLRSPLGESARTIRVALGVTSPHRQTVSSRWRSVRETVLSPGRRLSWMNSSSPAEEGGCGAISPSVMTQTILSAGN
jgi:hypothetical protein